MSRKKDKKTPKLTPKQKKLADAMDKRKKDRESKDSLAEQINFGGQFR